MNLTISVDEDILLLARQRALQECTSVEVLLVRHLEAYADVQRQAKALERFVELSRASGSGSEDRLRTRDELHQRQERP